MANPAQYATRWYISPARDTVCVLEAETVIAAITGRPGAHYRENIPQLLGLGFRIQEWDSQGSYELDTGTLHIGMCDARAAAELLVTWFFGLLPPDLPLIFNTEDGVENGYGDIDFELPRHGGLITVHRTLTDHLIHVWSPRHTP